MADQRKEYDPMQPDLEGGEMNSEHNLELSGMRRATTDKDEWTEEDRRRSKESGSMEAIRKQREEETGDPEQSTVRHLRSTSMTEGDEKLKKGGKGMAPRTPQEMDFADEISREPVRPRPEQKETGRGRGGA